MRQFGKKAGNLPRRIIPLLFLFITITVSAHAATVRGRLDRSNGYGGSYQVAYVMVTLYNDRLGRSAPAYTGTDGMYYLYNVPPDDYFLEVWLYPGRPPLRYSIQVRDPYTDIPPILLP